MVDNRPRTGRIGTCRIDKSAGDWGGSGPGSRCSAGSWPGSGRSALGGRMLVGRRRDPVLDRPDGVLPGLAPGRSAAALERPLGLRVPRPGREPDGRVLPAALAALRHACRRRSPAWLSLVLHTLWGALGANWAARRFGTSEVGRRPGGLRLGDLRVLPDPPPHQWGYTVGSWMPWAWGLAWQIGSRGGDEADPLAAGGGPGLAGLARPLPARLRDRGRLPGPGGGRGPVGRSADEWSCSWRWRG